MYTRIQFVVKKSQGAEIMSGKKHKVSLADNSPFLSGRQAKLFQFKNEVRFSNRLNPIR